MSGVLIIKPVSAKLRRDTETFGKMDPFCRVTIEGVSYETKVHTNGGKFPAWKDVLTFNRTNQNLMNIEVWDKDTFNDDMIGECTVPLSTIIEKKKCSDWYTLSYKGKNAGEVLLEAEWRPDNTTTQNTQMGHVAPSMMMGGSHQPFTPVYGAAYMLPQMYMNQPQPVYGQPVMQPVYTQPSPVYQQAVQQPQYVQPVSYQPQPQPMMQPTYVQPQPTYGQPQPQYGQPQPQYGQPQPMMQGYPQQMPQQMPGQQISYAPPGY